ncbi:M28 family peptidase [Scytonema millei VB511283]|uniref:M28 family peptidase n=2 Tax=Scytonema TaxID=1203 RepID=A0A9X5I2H5_9CYAN|nr:M28 family peptidase [Scytonema millei VB511283]
MVLLPQRPGAPSALFPLLPTPCSLLPMKYAILITTLVALPTASLAQSGRAGADVEALVKLGPRVAGTPVMAKASDYLEAEYRKAGYTTQIQTFTYSRFEDLGSSLTVGKTKITGLPLSGSVAGKADAPLVVVPNVGRQEDFARVDVKGAIAVVQRGEIRFSEKVQNASTAGAVAVAIINDRSGKLAASLGGGVSKIPVLTLSREQGSALLQSSQTQQPASLNVNTRQRQVTGRNVVAHLPGITKPQILLGAHYDSVPSAPGANDNASGTAVVLEIARRISKTPLANQTWFVAFDGEEDGLHGSKAFVQTAQPQFISSLKAMLNFDMVGVNPSLRVSGTPQLTARVKAAQSRLSTSESYSGSDHASFAAAKVPVLFFHRGREPNYHTPNDKQVDSNLLDETVSVGLEIVEQLL